MTNIIKSLNDELMQATYVVMVPDEVDAHGDVTSEDEVRKACHSFNAFCRQANLFHLVKTKDFSFAESYIAPVDFQLDDHLIKKGTWLAVTQTHNEELWGKQKSGEIVGLSIGAMATIEDVVEDD